MAEDRESMDVARVVQEHHAAVYRYAYRLTGSAADAEDLSQQAFLVAHQKIGQVREAEKVRGWLFAVLRTCFLRSVRKQRPIASTAIDLEVEHIPDEPLDDDIDREALQAAIDELPYEFRLVVVMFYFEQCSYREIAEQLEIPLGTVMSRLSRAKSNLRKRLTPGRDKSTAGQTTSDGTA